jgi:predicted NAD/FAD-dependent oxidoreductase
LLVLSYEVCGHLLQQQEETNTVFKVGRGLCGRAIEETGM